MFRVEKKYLLKAQRVISRVVKDLGTIYLLSSAKDKTLWLIANEPTHYMKIAIAEAEVTKSRLVGLKADVFSSILSMRGDVFDASYDKENSKLDVSCGSKNSVYVLDVDKGAIVREPDGRSKAIPISAKAVSSLREVFKAFTFSTPDLNYSGSALFTNNKEGMSVRYATVNTCAFYNTKTPIAKAEFEVTITMSMVMDILSIVSSSASISITDKEFSLISDSVEASIPVVEDETQGYVSFYETLRNKDQFQKGCISLVPKKALPALNSVCATSSGADLVKVSFKDKICKLDLDSRNGTGSDKFSLEKNTIGKLSLEIPEAYLKTTLNTAGSASEEVTLYVGVDGNLYKIQAENEHYSFMTVGPVSS